MSERRCAHAFKPCTLHSVLTDYAALLRAVLFAFARHCASLIFLMCKRRAACKHAS